MKREIFILFIAFFIATPIYAIKTPVTIQGRIKGLLGNNVILLNTNKKNILGRVKGLKETFKMKVNVEVGDGRLYFLSVPIINGIKLDSPSIPIFIDNKNMNIEAMIINRHILTLISANGSPTTNEYLKLTRQNPLLTEFNNAQLMYNQSMRNCDEFPNDPIKISKFQKTFTEFNKARINLTKSYTDMISAHPKSDALLAIIYNNNDTPSKKEMCQWMNTFDRSMQKKYYGKKIINSIESITNSQIHKEAPNFNLQNTNGKLIKLSSLRGKNILINFWSSWSDICINELYILKKISSEYKNKNLTIIGICINKDKQTWLNAIQKSQLNYLQLWDPEQTTSHSYNYAGLPFNILINSQGIIVARGLRGKSITTEISKLNL